MEKLVSSLDEAVDLKRLTATLIVADQSTLCFYNGYQKHESARNARDAARDRCLEDRLRI